MLGRQEMAVLSNDVRMFESSAGREGGGREDSRICSFSKGGRDDEA